MIGISLQAMIYDIILFIYHQGTHLRTKTIHKTVNPIFNETLTFYGVTPHDLSWQTLELKIIGEKILILLTLFAFAFLFYFDRVINYNMYVRNLNNP